MLIHVTSGMLIYKGFLYLFQSRTDDKVVRFKRAIGYYSATSKPVTFHPPHYLGKYIKASVMEADHAVTKGI